MIFPAWTKPEKTATDFQSPESRTPEVSALCECKRVLRRIISRSRAGWVGGCRGVAGGGGWLLCEVLLTACDRLRLAK